MIDKYIISSMCNGYYVKCLSQKDAIEFLTFLDEKGIKWHSGDRTIEDTYWDSNLYYRLMNNKLYATTRSNKCITIGEIECLPIMKKIINKMLHGKSVSCANQESDKMLRQQLDILGIRWCSGDKASELYKFSKKQVFSISDNRLSHSTDGFKPADIIFNINNIKE